MLDMDDSSFIGADLAEEEIVMDAVPERKDKRMRVQDLGTQLKDLRAKTSAELGSVAGLHRVLRCLPYAKVCPSCAVRDPCKSEVLAPLQYFNWQ